MGWLKRFWQWLDLTNTEEVVNVRWDPNSDLQRVIMSDLLNAPHETRAVMRMHRAGKPGGQICEILKISRQALMTQLQMAMDEEGAAHRRKVVIHDARVRKGAK